MIVVSDRGEQYLPGCLDSVAKWMRPTLPVHIVDDRDHKLGMAGAVRAGFAHAVEQCWDYAWWMEEDFRFNGTVPLAEMMVILIRRPHLAQVVLKRQAWSMEERAVGGIMELHPDDYTDHSAGGPLCEYAEHTRVFSLNPCLIPRRVMMLGWPESNEAGFTETCLHAGYRFAFYGKRAHPPRVTHVGDVRSAGWRL